MRLVRFDVLAATNQRQVPWEHYSLTDTVVLMPTASQPSVGHETKLGTVSTRPASPANIPLVAGQPSKLEKETPIVYSAWHKFCSNDKNRPDAKESCLTVKEARSKDGKFLAGAALIEEQGNQRKLFRITVPLGMQIPQGTRITVDGDQPLKGHYIVCLPNGCLADHDASPEFISKLKNGQTIVLQAINMPGQAVSYPIPLADFGKANDGPPTDPKKFEEEQAKLQAELQRRLEAQKRLKRQ